MAPQPLRERVNDPGFTPGLRDVDALLDLIAEGELAIAAERALLRLDLMHAPRAIALTIARATQAQRPARARLAAIVGRLAARGPEAVTASGRTWLEAALADTDPKTRRLAARALGKLAVHPTTERALLEAFEATSDDDDRRAIAEALGKVGGKAAQTRLAAARKTAQSGREASAPARLERLEKSVVRAELMLTRSAARVVPGAIDLTRALARPTVVHFHARDGLEAIVLGELGAAFAPRIIAPGLVCGTLRGPLSAAAQIRTALEFGFPLEPAPVGDTTDLAVTIARAVMSREAQAIFRAFTRTEGSPIRFRLAFAGKGHRRAVVWRVAELVAAETQDLVNDPTASTWEVVVDDTDDRVAIELFPRAWTDTRFAYREALVPASSNPTLAAAIARVAPRRDDDVIWDPFAGAGAELIERARLGPYAKLIGTDIEPHAIEAARTNVRAAKIAHVVLRGADATSYQPGPVNVILTNPPMGRRVQRGAHTELLEQFIANAARVLSPGGALVWLVPEPKRLRDAAERAGLIVERAFPIDMGGFTAELTIHRKGSHAAAGKVAPQAASGKAGRQVAPETKRGPVKR